MTQGVTGQNLFEHPLNEKCRTLLRLSHLFEQFDFHSPHDASWHARAAISALLDIGSVLSRADIKSDLLKDLERHHNTLARIADTPGVDGDRLQHVLQELRNAQSAIQTIQGQLGLSLRSSEFLNSVLQRSSIPGGNCDFDLPLLHFWLCQPHAERLLQFDSWRSEVAPVHEAVELLLTLIRGSTHRRPETAHAGFFQYSLPSGSAAQMVQVTLPADSTLYAEFSGSKHRFTVRFMEALEWDHPILAEEDIEFGLKVCIL